MPQLDPNSFPPQLIWLAITFVVMYLLMARLALPRVSEVLEERRHRIDDDLERAASAKAEADEATRKYESALASVREEAQQRIRDAGDKVAREAAERQRESSERLARQIEESERAVAGAKQSALAELRSMAVDAASLAAARLAGVEPRKDEVEGAVDAAMKERA